MSTKVVIIGAFVEIIELAEESGLKILGLIDNSKKREYLGYPILGNDEDAKEILSKNKKISVIISPDLPETREKLHQRYKGIGFDFTGIVSNFSKVSKSTQIGEGTVIQALVNVSSECIIGDFVKLNTLCNIMHNSFIGNYTTVAPNAVILGNVSIGSRCYIGANATVLPNLNIADDVVIGAGAVVTKSIFEIGVYVGCPAKKL
ncbi:MAG: NeuD/PglB/VioB family sugar acetyltransferase [bacterium]